MASSTSRVQGETTGTVTTSVYLSTLPASDTTQQRAITTSTHSEPVPDEPHEPWDRYDETNEGWIVVAACSAFFFVFLGLTYSYGIIQLHLAKAKLANVSTLSFVGSLAASLSPLAGMLVARVVGKIGYRFTLLMGGFFIGLGEFTASWSTKSVAAIFITQGFIFGAGAAFCFLVRSTSFFVMLFC